jgi:hypothetical protein
MSTLSGYVVYEPDNDTYFFREYPKPWTEIKEAFDSYQELTPDMSGQPRHGMNRCEACGELLDKWHEPLAGLKIKRRKYDISCTYDGLTIVSQRFRDIVEAESLHGLVFRQLPDDPGFYAIQAKPVVKFDAVRRGTTFENQCPVCGYYEEVIGATPVYLKERETVPVRGFARTDLEFASGDAKHPLLLCDLETGRVLKNAGLKGLDLVEF